MIDSELCIVLSSKEFDRIQMSNILLGYGKINRIIAVHDRYGRFCGVLYIRFEKKTDSSRALSSINANGINGTGAIARYVTAPEYIVSNAVEIEDVWFNYLEDTALEKTCTYDPFADGSQNSNRLFRNGFYFRENHRAYIPNPRYRGFVFE